MITERTRNRFRVTLAAVFLVSFAPGAAHAEDAFFTGGPQQVKYSGCHPQDLEASIFAATSPRARGNAIQNFFDTCGKSLSEYSKEELLGVYQEYQVFMPKLHKYAYPARKPVEIKTADGLRTAAWLFVKPGKVAPLVIFKCGFQCDLEQSDIAAQFVMMLFEEGPFHVLFLPSTSGPDFQSRNGVFTVGGFHEGQQIFEIARLVQDDSSPVKNLLPVSQISGVHVVGISMGGHAAEYAAIYNDANLKPDHSRYINSFVAACPVVDLQGTQQTLFGNPPVPQLGSIFFNALLKQLKTLIDKIPAIRKVTGSSTNITRGNIHQVAAQAMLPYLQEQFVSIAPYAQTKIRSIDDYFALNAFQKQAAKVTDSPLYVWSTGNDWVVDFHRNAEALIDNSTDNPNINILSTYAGTHCLFSNAFGWDIMSSWVRSLLIAHSPELLAARATRLQHVSARSVAFGGDFRTHNSGNLRTGFEWIISAGSEQATLRSHILANFSADVPERHTAVALVPLKLLNLSPPTSSAEAEAMTRWLNANVRPVDASGNTPASDQNPTFFDWVNY